jgi:hypothetical protein
METTFHCDFGCVEEECGTCNAMIAAPPATIALAAGTPIASA